MTIRDSLLRFINPLLSLDRFLWLDHVLLFHLLSIGCSERWSILALWIDGVIISGIPFHLGQ